MSPPSPPADAPRFHLHAWTPAARLASAVFRGLALLTLLLAAVVVAEFTFTGVANPRPPRLAGVLALVSALWLGAEGLVRRLTAATLDVEPERLVLERPGERLEVPVASVAAVRVWRLPWLAAGLSVRLRSGRSLGVGLRVEDPLPVLAALGRHLPEAREVARQPLAAFAHARATVLRPGVGLWVLQFVLFPLLPGGIMFRADQYITYGGPFAQYQMYGLGPYLGSLFTYWVSFIAMLVLYATLWRLPAEALALGATWVRPDQARGVRRFTEVGCAVLYYAGSLSLLAARFLA
ncbi:hypothetical protein [Archangium primigenium]|uniref:hypothetical protein n=1 Tax=[Archangium] primigenium TaxID=2792470 RepID=UPI001956D7C1|nr:hypothetical protein [Archangium primigenium]MBM7117153.1 hypothetical protein [Archangium primigenium]